MSIVSEPPESDLANIEIGPQIHATKPIAGGAIIAAFALIAIGTTGAYLISLSHPATSAMRSSGIVSVLLVLVLFSIALERLLDPFTRWLPWFSFDGHDKSNLRDTAKQEHQRIPTDRRPPDQTTYDTGRAKASRALLLWSIAVALSTALSAVADFYALHGIMYPWVGIPLWIDSLATGLMVGSSTWAVHHLITRIRKK